MCFSATVSYSAAAILAATGTYAVRKARRLPDTRWLMWALVPVLFGVQQGFEGLVWQQLDSGNARAALPYALGFHFFSHFLWLWWPGLGSCLVEPGRIRRKVLAGFTLFGAFAGTLVYSVMVMHPDWMKVSVRDHSIAYKFTVQYESPIHLPITAAMLYALTILVPLLFSSHRQIRIFGVLAVLSSLLASQVYGYAYVSVWCFFAAALSLYLVHMIRGLAAANTVKA